LVLVLLDKLILVEKEATQYFLLLHQLVAVVVRLQILIEMAAEEAAGVKQMLLLELVLLIKALAVVMLMSHTVLQIGKVAEVAVLVV
jgi:hypothetical protein